MSNLLNQILNNSSTRIMVAIYMLILFITGFFLTYEFFHEKTLYDKLSAERLQSIAATSAMQIDGDCLENLLNTHPFIDDIDSVNYTADSCFLSIQNTLNKTKEFNALNDILYTLVYNKDEGIFQFGVTGGSVFYRHKYELFPEILKTNYEKGGIVERYSTENGEWISGFYPIKNSKGETISVVQADVNLTAHDQEIWDEYVNKSLISLGVILFIAILLLPYMKKILKEDERIRKALYDQKKEIEVKNKDLTDSINYAKKIQLAILPDKEYIDKSLNNSFIFYRPKDIVSGDFYWCRNVGNTTLIACADCTGHGIPGALMSMIGNSVLNEIINNKKGNNIDPGNILDQLEKGVNEALSTRDYETQTKDGMDISLCCIENDKRVIHYAGALRPLLIINDDGYKEIKGNRFPIGGGDTYKKGNFRTHTINIKDGDKFYMYSDGFPDQFGGEKGKKYMNKKFKNLLFENHRKNSSEQFEILKNELNVWKGDREQIDDILIIGILY